MQPGGGFPVDKANVQPARADHVGNIGIVPLQQLKADARVVLPEGTDHRGQPQGRDARKGADADDAGHKALQILHGGVHQFVLGYRAPDVGEKLFAFGSKRDAVTGAPDQRDGKLRFQRGDHLADSGLGIAQFGSGLPEAAAVQNS